VDTGTGTLLAERIKIATPQPPSPARSRTSWPTRCEVQLDRPGGVAFPV
jgi:hypothetical protein